MFCGACGSENLDDLQFCVRCGAALGRQRTPAPGRASAAGGQAQRHQHAGGGDVGSDLGMSLGGFATGGFARPQAQGLMTPPGFSTPPGGRGAPRPSGGDHGSGGDRGSGGDVGSNLGASLGGFATGGGFKRPSGGDIGADLSRSLGSAHTGVPGSGGGGGQASDAYAVAMGVGTLLGDRYEVKALLGRGGMGAVYKVLDRLRGKEVAVKVMLPSLMAREKAVERFLHEAELSLTLSHEKIVRVFDVGEDRALGLRFYTMELLQGMSLRDWLEEKQKLGVPLTPDEAIDLMDQLLEALAVAHRTTIHRDLKPENLMIAPAEKGVALKILDFGIAKLKGAKQFTSTSMALGTAYYMAPEQQTDAANVDARADLYSVGVIFYELLTGRLPVGRFKTPSEERPALPRALDALILRALESDPARRPASAEAFLADLRALRTKGGGSVSKGGGGGGAKLAAGIAAALALLVGGGLYARQAGLLGGPEKVGPATIVSSSTAGTSGKSSGAGKDPSKAGSTPEGATPREGPRPADGVGQDPKAASKPPSGAGDGATPTKGGPPPGPSPAGSSTESIAAPTTPPPPPKPIPPRLAALASPIEDALVSGDVSVQGRVEGPVARVVVNGTPTDVKDGAFALTVPGAAEIVIRGFDAQNEQAFERRVQVRLDNDPPVVTFKTPRRVVTRESEVEIAGTVSDAHPTATVEVDGASYPLQGGAFSARRRLERGAKPITIVALDEAGNRREVAVTAIQDREAPQVTVAFPQDGLVTREKAVVVRGEVKDEFGVARVLVNDAPATLDRGRSFSATIPLGRDGAHAIVVSAVDEAGNASAPTSLEVRRDQRPPEILLDPLPGSITSARVAIKGALDEEGCTVTVDGAPVLVTGQRFEAMVDARTARTAVVEAQDALGNMARKDVRITPAAPPPPPPPAGPSGEVATTPSTGSSTGGSTAEPAAPVSALAPGSVEGAGGVIGIVERIDKGFGIVVVKVAPGARVKTDDILEVVRGEGVVSKIGRVRVGRVQPGKSTFSAGSDRGEPIERFRPGDRLVIPRG